MKVIRDLREWRQLRAQLGGSVGFVPTMGALHPGHRSLVERSRRENERTVVSIFVNPTQFNDPRDFEKYPKTWEADLRMLEECGADYLLAPEYASIYPDQFRYSVDESEFSQLLCGARRPGHFKGVLTVVMKLLNLARADRAYFGEKDFQQLKLIEGMVRAFFMATEIVPCPTVREADGSAMSSRNLRLSAEDREKAPLFHRLLASGMPQAHIHEELTRSGFEVEYIEEIDGRRFGAVWLGGVRLIDNVAL